MKNACAVILAAGEGKRMKSVKPKALGNVLFKPMLDWVLEAVNGCGIDNICVIVGHRAEDIEVHLNGKYEVAMQEERLGTGHAVMRAASFLHNSDAENVLILNGDAPFIDSSTIEAAFGMHLAMESSVTVVSANIEEPRGYGRIARDANGRFMRIIEERDATDEERKLKEVNSGAYWFNKEALFRVLSSIGQENDAHEYYLTDTIEEIKKEGGRVCVYMTDNSNVVLGANDRYQLMELNEIARREVLLKHMTNGVNIPCTDGIIIGTEVRIGCETTVYPGTILKGDTEIGEACEVGPNCIISSSKLEDGVSVRNSEIENSIVQKDSYLPSFTRMLSNAKIGENRF